MRLSFVCIFYLQISVCFQPVWFQPSKNVALMAENPKAEGELPELPSVEKSGLKETRCFIDCLNSCGHAWSYCTRVAVFLGPIIEYTGIYLEEEDYDDRSKILTTSGALEGLAAAAATICRGKQENQELQCEEVWQFKVSLYLSQIKLTYILYFFLEMIKLCYHFFQTKSQTNLRIELLRDSLCQNQVKFP